MQILLRILLTIGTLGTSTSDVDATRLEVRLAEVFHHLYDTLQLHEAARELPDVSSPDLADRFVDVALELQTPRVPAALIIALAWGESRFDASARPACGVMQVYPRDLGEPAASCAEWRRDLHAGVRAGVREIETMLADKRVRGNMRLALLYRACGNKAFDGTCDAKKYAWVTTAMARWHSIVSQRAHLPPPKIVT